jgi:hypothetical protein
MKTIGEWLSAYKLASGRPDEILRKVGYCWRLRDEVAMKTIFIDCNDELDQVFARVHRSDDPSIVVNTKPPAASDLPRVLDGYAICLDDHSYMPTEIIARCAALKHIVSPWHRGIELHGRAGASRRAASPYIPSRATATARSPSTRSR